jgi:hypothetical protein
MAAAIGIITIGGLLIASGLKGVGLTDLLSGAVGGVLNPKGGARTFATPTGAPPGPGGPGGLGEVSTAGGAKGLVDSLVGVAQAAGGGGVFVVSALRAGGTTSSGNVSDHAANDSGRAARDIAVKGVDAIKGPPMPELDKAVVAIGAALGRDFKGGQSIVDTFTYQGMRVQVIWRTPAYGGHMGHIHVGAHKA